MTKPFFILQILCFFCCNSALAQLSQLEFDTPAISDRKQELESKRKKELDRLQQAEREAQAAAKRLLEEESAKQLLASQQEQARARMSVAKKDNDPQEPTNVEKSPQGHEIYLDGLPGEGEFARFLPPSTQGPATDSGSETTITSENKWKSSKDQKCWDLQSKSELTKKSAALAEILSRYTGNSAYYESLRELVCQPKCSDNPSAATITGLSLVDAAGGVYEIAPLEDSCVYRLSREEDKAWPVLEGRKVVCHCL